MAERTNDPVLITLAARAGKLTKVELAFWHCLLYHSEHGGLPAGDGIMDGTRQRFGKRINRSAAFRGLQRARETLAAGMTAEPSSQTRVSLSDTSRPVAPVQIPQLAA